MSKFNEQTVISKNLIAQEKSEDGSVLWQITAKGTLQVSVAAIENLERQFYHYGNEDSSWDDDDDSTQKRPMTWEEKKPLPTAASYLPLGEHTTVKFGTLNCPRVFAVSRHMPFSAYPTWKLFGFQRM